jgi:hypothetical protein
MNRAASVVVILFFSCVSDQHGGDGCAQGTGTSDIPASLEPWKEWVLHGKCGLSACPTHFNDGTIRRCWWPSRLAMNVGAGAVCSNSR